MAVNDNPRFQTPRAAYIHVPFCRHRCGYCNFTLVAGRDDLITSYQEALRRELTTLAEPRPVDTLFIGGGTPSHLGPDQLTELLNEVQRWLPLSDQGEFSIEANPADLNREKTRVLLDHGVNRISLGVQSFDADKLTLLERDHTPGDIDMALEHARDVTSNVSLDLIFAVPGETAATWQADLEAALQRQPVHLSTYGLTIEPGTRFFGARYRGHLQEVPEEDQRVRYETTIELLTKAGYGHYEVSNFALPGRACRHNETYWLGHTFYGFGPGAARHVDGRRETNHRSTTTYLRRMLNGESPVVDREELSPRDAAAERLAFGLRRRAGVDMEQFTAETGYPPRALVEQQWNDWIQHQLLELVQGQLRLTHRGLLVADSICAAIVQACSSE